MNNEENLEINELLDKPGQWFVINCSTGHEEKVLTDLNQKIKTTNLEKDVFDMRISKGVLTTKTGKQVIKNRFPGYIFVNMNMSEQAWFVVRNTPGVTGFIGSSGKGAKPFPLTTNEVIKMLSTPDEIVHDQNLTDLDEIKGDIIEESQTKNQKPKGVVVAKKVKHEANFELNDYVRIINGPYKNEEGKVIDIDYSKGVAIVSLEIFGRYTPAEVSFTNLEPVKEY